MQQDSVDLGERAGDVVSPTRRDLVATISDLVRGDESKPDQRVTLVEAVALCAAALVGLVALTSLATAHLHHYRTWLVWLVSLALIGLVAVGVWRWDRPEVRLDWLGLLPAVVGGAIASVMMFPGFQYATGDRDPGAYVQHAVAIQRSGSIDFTDDLLANHLPAFISPGSAWPGLWIEPGHNDKIFPQFYHLWSALLATAKGSGGYTGLFNTGPLIGAFCVVFAVCIGRRLAGWPGAWTAAALLSTNMLQVWQAKYPSSEIFAQFLFLGATLGIVIAVTSRWRSAAALGGTLIALTYLERPDGLVLILMSWAGLCALVAVRRFDSRAVWFAVGLCALLPYGFLQAYHLARHYTLVNTVPSLPKVLAVMVALAAVATLIAWRQRETSRVLAWSARTRVRFALGAAVVAGCALLMVLGGLRPLFGQDHSLYSGRPIRTYDEISFIRLGWFFSLPALALMGFGIVYVAMRKWRVEAWVVALPAISLITLYCYHVKNSPYMMWATRRFVPTAVPGMVLLIGCGIALAVIVIKRLLPMPKARPLAAAAVAVTLVSLMIFYVRQSWPLRHHNENGGSVEVVEQIAAVAGGQKGIFLWQPASYCCAFPSQLFGGPLFTIANQSSAPLSNDPSLQPGGVKQYLAYATSTGRPLFYIADRTSPPPAVDGVTATKVKELVGVLPHWQETFVSRPSKTKNYPYDMNIYRLTAR